MIFSFGLLNDKYCFLNRRRSTRKFITEKEKKVMGFFFAKNNFVFIFATAFKAITG